jgi:hypothetical protein
MMLGLYSSELVQTVVHPSKAELDGIQPALHMMESQENE